MGIARRSPALLLVPAIALALAIAVAAGCTTQRAWTLEPGQHPEHFERRMSVLAEGRMLLYLPAGFERHGGRRYPLLIFLHGSGEAGADLDKVKAHGPPSFLGTRTDFPFIVASPQAPNAMLPDFDPTVLEAMLDELLDRLPIDRQRIYLTGLSLGGMWSYGWAALHPERFAAIAPVSGNWDPAVACALKNVPVWAFHGEKDDVVPLAGDRAMVDAINACGGHARLTVYPDVGHDAWNPAYADPELYSWLLQQRRQRAAR